MPFVTSVRLEHTVKSVINQPNQTPAALAAAIARQTFFIGCDWKKCEEYTDRYARLPLNQTQQDKILAQLLAFSLTNNYKPPETDETTSFY
jgi:hypothetical protein